ncbi:MAG: hypothetical protein ABII06_18575 [Pseudomonadota bacterium]
MMDAQGVGSTQDKPSFSERFHKKLHYWFVQYNPLYFFSAFCVLFGVYLISQGLEEMGWENGQLMLTGVMQFYEVLIIAGAAVLFRYAGQVRPAVILTLIEIFFLFDCTFRTEIVATLEGLGLLTSGGWVVMAALKIAALAWVFRLKVSPYALLIPVLAAAGVAGVPYLFHLYPGYRTMIHLGAIWYGVFLTASVLFLRPKVRPLITLDEWGQTVLRRTLKTAIAIWAGFYVFHLITWIELFEIPYTTAQIAPFFLLWFLAKRETWSWAGGLLVILFSLWIPASVAPTALIAGIAFGIKARQMRKDRLYIGTVLGFYIALWTIGWQGKGFPEPNLWLHVLAVLVLLGMGWRMRLSYAYAAAVLLLLPGAGRLVPRGAFQWGITLIVTGFVSLIAGVAVNLGLKKSEAESEIKALSREQAEMLERLRDDYGNEHLSSREAAIVGLWHYFMAGNVSFETMPDMRSRKLRNALLSYASLNAGEVVIALQDSTVFGSARWGCLVTTTGIHYRSPETRESGFLRYGEIEPTLIRQPGSQSVYVGSEHKIELSGVEQKKDFPNFVRYLKNAGALSSDEKR